MNKKYYIYKFTNKNGDILYIGKTINLKDRLKKHLSGTNQTNSKLKLYKEFKEIYYYECKNEKEMNELELYYIKLYKPQYNILSYNTSGEEDFQNICTDNIVWTEFKELKISKSLNEKIEVFELLECFEEIFNKYNVNSVSIYADFDYIFFQKLNNRLSLFWSLGYHIDYFNNHFSFSKIEDDENFNHTFLSNEKIIVNNESLYLTNYVYNKITKL